MIDRRELVLARCAVLIGQVPGIELGERNRGEVTGKRRPAIILNDGAEEVIERDAGDASGSRNSRIQAMRMEPQFLIKYQAAAADAGPRGNELRDALLKTLFSDSELLTLLELDGQRISVIKYLGGGLTTEEGEQRECTFEVNLGLTYIFRLSELLT